MSSVEWDPKVRDFLRKLPKDIAQRIFKKVDEEIRFNVKRHIEPLVKIDGGKIRVGDYRLLVDFYQDKDLLVIRSIRHRRDAYKFW